MATDEHHPTMRPATASRPPTARALWVEGEGVLAVRDQPLEDPGPEEVRVRTLASGVSRGTERLVLTGRVPASQRDRMRAPFQHGDLPWPVSHGYLAVGVVEAGPPALRDRTVFCLHPHHDRFVVPAAAVHVVPDGVPARRAVLAGTVETAVNALWDAGVRLGDSVAVVGAGMVGACVARLAAQVPGCRVDLVDPAPERAVLAGALGVSHRTPEELDGVVGSHDVVVHASATAAGLALALRLAPDDGEVVELSWFGSHAPEVPLGDDVHARRVAIRPSQVGAVARARRERRTPADRLALALRLLTDPAFDHLLGPEVPLDDAPTVLPGLLLDDAGGGGPCPVITYGA
ncbi:zinc-binding alcohol dehydrogenase [Aquipuribacter nitratireducens]|uniref:Zinc-binding alcohol dehydrogenase n=1 Tax=Aquipuribacter nitratireducens TaxID=650104 RepID=A0ABW0GRP6_9MICO